MDALQEQVSACESSDAVMQAAARAMVAAKKPGSIINFSSQAGHRGEALVAHYCATKAAVISYTQSAALALAARGGGRIAPGTATRKASLSFV